MKFLLLSLIISTSLFAQREFDLVEKAMEEIQCRTNSKNKRVFINFGTELYSKEIFEKQRALLFEGGKAAKDVPSRFLTNKVRIAKSADGDIFISEREGDYQSFYAYLCHRPGQSIKSSSVLSNKVSMRRLSKKSCKLKQMTGQMELMLDSEQGSKATILKLKMLPLNYMASDSDNEQDFPYSVCSREHFKEHGYKDKKVINRKSDLERRAEWNMYWNVRFSRGL